MTYRNAKLRKSAEGESCVACGSTYGVVWAHANSQTFGKGMGIKASDAAGMYLCYVCHCAHDQGKVGTKEERRESEFKWIAQSLVRAIENGVLK